jgi:predicted nuclease of predicted toxin-antitoxin system
MKAMANVHKSQVDAGRPIVEILREARERNLTVTLDEDFGVDLAAIAQAHHKPWNPPSWD